MACRKCSFRKKLNRYSDNSRTQPVYLDYNATTPVDIRVLGIYEKTSRLNWANPSSFHSAGQGAFQFLESKRKEMAEYLNIGPPENLFFTYSSIGALSSSLKLFLDEKKIKTIITTEIEHSSVYRALESISDKSVEQVPLSVDCNGRINLDDLEKVLKTGKAILVFSPVNHETGSVQEYENIFLLAERYSSFVIFDAIQTLSRIDIIRWSQYCHSFVISSHKIYGPKGIVLLYISPYAKISIDDTSCVQESGLFPGTENLPLIASFTEAIRIYSENIKSDLHHYDILTEEAYSILEQSSVNYCRETPENSVPGILSISLTQADISMEELFLFLYKEKICISRFSACSGEIEGPSKILSAMGRAEDHSNQSLRISLGRESQRSDIYSLVKALKTFLTGQNQKKKSHYY